MKKLLALLLAMMLALSLAACGDTANAESNNPQNSESVTASEAPAPSETAETTPEPTPEPTLTPLVVPDPVVYTGSGDDVISIEPPDGLWVLTISGNSEGRHFAVKGYDDNLNSTELFVNTTDPYSGTTIDPSFSTTTLEISAKGSWTVAVRSIYEMSIVSGGETYTGTGDSVFLVSGVNTTATIEGNSGGRHFAVHSYGTESNELLVNTTDPYSGKVLLRGNPVVISVDAEGDWSITLD